jgi:hypothetical protein
VLDRRENGAGEQDGAQKRRAVAVEASGENHNGMHTSPPGLGFTGEGGPEPPLLIHSTAIYRRGRR